MIEFIRKGGQDSPRSPHTVVPKTWGEEIILHNGTDYCGKILRFKPGSRFSMHFHLLKTETWYVNKGRFYLKYIDTSNAETFCTELSEGDIIEVDKGTPHQLISLDEGEIFEASTMHYDYDSYRVEKGDSQK